ncbi:hypothetical protein WJX84_004840 [Apatococcus fuscideae]|uniref:oligopeptidase A n=1 Tax=Apatococcus fuscideae TaxID=2026836 RepID=A0AAW1SX10_9CHLO
MASPAPTADESAVTNPLLQAEAFPLFDVVDATHVRPAINEILRDTNQQIDELEASAKPTWEALVEPLERLGDRLERAWGTVNHLKAVKDNKELREAVEEVQPEVVAVSLRLSQSKPVYEAFQSLKEGSAWSQLTEAQQRIVDKNLREFTLGGVALEGADRERFNEIKKELSKLSTKFSNNVLDATKAFKKLITDKALVDGLPQSALGLAAQQAKAQGHDEATAESGPWLITLDFPSYFPVMSHAKNRSLREEVYRASLTKASSGELDNTPIINKILSLKQETAKLLGFQNYGQVSMASKMASLEKADALLEELRSASFKPAQEELEEVRQFAKGKGFTEELRQWDVTFWAERLREAKYDITDEELRPFFALPSVLEGLFKLTENLFGVQVTAADGKVPVWHKDVRYFCIKQDGKPRAYCYFDPYSRPAEKRGGAWMDEVVGRSKLMALPGEDVRLPVAHMVCNQTPPVGEQPSLMTFREVETLFHEFGHALQHMLTTQSEGMVAGIRGIEWDAVELPSQFMENWAYNRAVLYSFAKHFETGEPLPEQIYQKLLAARTFRSGSMTLRQVHFASVDIELHARYQTGGSESVFDVDRRIAQKTAVMPPLPEDRFLCSFSHIFAGGYSCGYYSYKWAEVLSADAFSAFEEAGVDDLSAVQKVGQRFRDTVLAFGGGRFPGEVFKDFRGREPSTEPLLRHSSLVTAAA